MPGRSRKVSYRRCAQFNPQHIGETPFYRTQYHIPYHIGDIAARASFL
jgi:hypothetical protein